MHKVLIGVNTFNDLPFLRESLPVVEELRRVLPADVVVLDTARNDEVKSYVKKEFSKFKYMRHKDGNIGYGRSYNEILKANSGHDYFLVYTSDVFLDVSTVKKFLKRMEADKSITMCAGKLHYWDLANHRRTEKIDTVGIMAEKRHQFYDRGCGEVDKGQYDDVLGEAFGISGAVFLIRTGVVDPLFDEKMWMYKEDIDLSYRLRWLGEKIMIFPEVWGWHARTVAKGKKKSVRAVEESYKNHLLLLKNNLVWGYGISVLVRVLGYEILKGIYMLFRHPRVFFAGVKSLLFVRGTRSVRRVSSKVMLSYFK